MQPKKWAQFAGGGFSWTEYSRRAGNFFCMGRQFDGPIGTKTNKQQRQPFSGADTFCDEIFYYFLTLPFELLSLRNHETDVYLPTVHNTTATEPGKES